MSIPAPSLSLSLSRVCAYVCMCVYVCVYLSVRVCVYVCMYVCVYVRPAQQLPLEGVCSPSHLTQDSSFPGPRHVPSSAGCSPCIPCARHGSICSPVERSRLVRHAARSSSMPALASMIAHRLHIIHLVFDQAGVDLVGTGGRDGGGKGDIVLGAWVVLTRSYGPIRWWMNTGDAGEEGSSTRYGSPDATARPLRKRVLQVRFWNGGRERSGRGALVVFAGTSIDLRILQRVPGGRTWRGY